VTRRGRVALKVAAWAACLAPLAWLLYRAATNDLTANPISFITNWLGDWTLRILLTSLAMTPLRLLFRWSWPVALRRLLGLFAFFYASLHFSVWLVLDHFFAWRQMGADILKRPYITVGMAALLLLIPLSVALVLLIGAGFWWSVASGQFDDLEGPAHRILADDDRAAPAPPADTKSAMGAMTEIKLSAGGDR